MLRVAIENPWQYSSRRMWRGVRAVVFMDRGDSLHVGMLVLHDDEIWVEEECMREDCAELLGSTARSSEGA